MMASSGKVVEVLCPSGRRQKVKTTPSMTVFQVLQQVCEKQDYADAEYDLKHQRKILNVTSMMRFLNLPNNAKLELVKCEKARLVSTVTVALQMEDGTRQQDDFNPDTTLLVIIKTFFNKPESFEDNAHQEPVCVYMRNEYKGVVVLSTTTLKSIGITTGRAALRLLFRDKEVREEPRTDKVSSVTSLMKNNSSPSSTLEPNGKKIKLGTSEDEASTVSEKRITSQESRVPDASIEGSTASSEGSAYAPLSIIGAPPRQIFPDDVEMKNVEESKSLRDPGVFNLPSTNEFANFKFPENSSNDDTDPVAIDPTLIRKEVKLGMPCSREPVVFSMEGTHTVLESNEVDDSFFQVTIDDLRKRLSDLKSEKKGKEEELLMTSALRQQKRLEKISNFEMIPVRLMLPGKLVIQGIFRPLETVGALNVFLREYLSTDIEKYELFVTPPRIVLKDKNQTLYDAKLFPAAVVHVSFHSAPGPHLREEYLDKLSTCDDAEAVVDKVLKRNQFNNSSDSVSNKSSDGAHTAEKPVAQFQQPLASTSRTTHSTLQDNQRPKGAPKWFKTGR